MCVYLYHLCALDQVIFLFLHSSHPTATFGEVISVVSECPWCGAES